MKNLKSSLIIATVFVCFVLVGIFQFQRSQAQTTFTTISGKFYKLDLLATNTSLGVTSISPGTSINDNGLVAFSTTSISGGALLTADGINPVTGCPFHTRCPYAIAECSTIVPSLVEIKPRTRPPASESARSIRISKKM